MENETISSKKIMITYGILLGLISVLFGAVIYVADMYKDPHWSIIVLGLSITILILVYGIKSFKKNNNGFLNLSDALKIGIGIAIIGGLITGIWNLTLNSVIEPGFSSKMIQIQKDKTIEENPDLTPEEIELRFSIQEKISKSPGVSFTLEILGSIFYGFIISLIAGLAMQRKQELY